MTREAVIYARFSTLEQAKGYSLERQIANGTRYVEQQGWSLFDVISDEGRSAFSGANRLTGSSLFQFEAEAREGLHRGKVLCVENIDRLSRQGAKVAAQLIWALNANGVDVSTWHDGLTYRAGSDGNMGELMMLIMIAERAWEESKTKSERTGDSWKDRYAKIANGDRTVLVGRTPAWIEEVGGRYKLIDRRKKLLNEMFDLYINGVGTYKIVQILNARKEEGWASPREDKNTGEIIKSKGWYLAYVHRLLTSRAVLGEYTKLTGETVALDYWPPAISVEKFNRALAVRAGRRTTKGGNRKRSNNLLGGMVRCSKCGGTGGYENKGENSVTRYVGKAGIERSYQRKHYERFRCDSNRRKAGCDNSTLFDYKVVEGAVLDRLLALSVDDDAANPKVTALREQIAEVDRLRSHTNTQLQNIVDALADGASKALTARLARLESELEQQEKSSRRLREELALVDSLPETSDDLALIADLRASLRDEDAERRFYARTQTNMALRRVLDAVLLDEDGTFAILAGAGVWHFDGEGQYIGGQAI